MTPPPKQDDLDRELDLDTDHDVAMAGSSAPPMRGAVLLTASIVAGSLLLAGLVHIGRTGAPITLSPALGSIAMLPGAVADATPPTPEPKAEVTKVTVKATAKPRSPIANAQAPTVEPVVAAAKPKVSALPAPALDASERLAPDAAAEKQPAQDDSADEANEPSTLPTLSDLEDPLGKVDSIFEPDDSDDADEPGEEIVFDNEPDEEDAPEAPAPEANEPEAASAQPAPAEPVSGIADPAA